MDIRLALIAGNDIPVPELGMVIHQPTIKEIGYIGEQDFFSGAQCLCINKSMYQGTEIAEANNFTILMMLLHDERTKDKKASVKSVLTLLFPQYQIFFTPRAISFNRNDETFTIDEGNFEGLQSILKQIFCLGASGQESFNPADEKAKEIADKLMKARAKVAEQKGANQNSVFTQYLSILTVGMGSMSLPELLNITIYQLYDLVERYMLFVNWDQDNKIRLAGGKPDSKPENWMKNIH